MGYMDGHVDYDYHWKWADIVDVNRFRYCLSGSPESRLAAVKKERNKEEQWVPHAVTLDELIQHEGTKCLEVDGFMTTGPMFDGWGPSTGGQCPFKGKIHSLSNDTGAFHVINPAELESARAIPSKVLAYNNGFFLNIQGYSVGDVYPPFPLQPDCTDLWSPHIVA